MTLEKDDEIGKESEEESGMVTVPAELVKRQKPRCSHSASASCCNRVRLRGKGINCEGTCNNKGFQILKGFQVPEHDEEEVEEHAVPLKQEEEQEDPEGESDDEEWLRTIFRPRSEVEVKRQRKVREEEEIARKKRSRSIRT